MKKLILLAVLAVGAVCMSMTTEAKADHLGGCRSGFYGGYSYAPSYSYGYSPSYYSSPGYAAPVYSYGPVNSWGYGYPTTGFYYGRPSLSISIGSGYRGYSYGGYGRGHHHHHHRHW